MIRIVTTESSIWTFDLERNLYKREPTNSPTYLSDETIPYTNEWEPFVTLIEDHAFGEDRLLVVRPVAVGGGAMRVTGHILRDETVPDLVFEGPTSYDEGMEVKQGEQQ